MATKHPDPKDEGDRSGQTPDRKHDDGDSSRGGSTTSRRQIVDEALDFVLTHDAALLRRLADA